MADREPYKWITVKGKHIPVYKDEHGQDVFGKGREDYTSSEEMAKRVVGEDDPYFSDQYKQLSDKVYDLKNERNKIDAELSDLQKQLNAESYQTEDDIEFERVMGKSYKGLFKHYTDKGEELKQQVRPLQDKRNQIKEDINFAESQLSVLNNRNRMNQQHEWLQRISTQSTMQKPTKQNYPGFKLNESTTSAIDNALKNGQAHVVEMSPKEYIERVNYQIFNKYTTAQNISGRSYNTVNEYAEMMRQGVKFDTPYLDYDEEGQEGIHRALAAIQNGYERIPVIVVPKKRKS